MNEIEWLEPWDSLCTKPDLFEKELYKEVGEFHILYGKKVSAIGRRYDCDDFLFRIYDSDFNYAVVHLTYTNCKMGKINHNYPTTSVFKNLDSWINECMIPAHSEYTFSEEE